MKKHVEFLPAARCEGIICKEVDGELLIYDLERNKAHCLNSTAALVWQHCDGQTSVTELARAVSTALDTRFGETVIELALTQLSRDHLLCETDEGLPVVADLSRRALVRRLGFGAVLLPLITTITAPTALAATSNCIPSGGACTDGGLPCCGATSCQGGTCF
jgi:hypothetical protein